MKYLFLVLISFPVMAETYVLEKSSANYVVKAFGKTVVGESKDLKGKMSCSDAECEFLVAAPVSSFISADANRDENMKAATEASVIPIVSGSGKFLKTNLSQEKWKLPLEVDFHGQKEKYEAQIRKTGSNTFKADFILKLDQHKINRPSLFGFKIQNDVPMAFDLHWGLTKSFHKDIHSNNN